MVAYLIDKLVKENGPILITGHTGFKGTWMTLLLEKLGIPVVGYSLEPTESSLFKRLNRTGKITEAKVILDLVEQTVIKVDLPNVPKDFPFEALYKHYRKWYADAIDEFLK